ncbi:hypothetical protein ACTFIV_008918 [Dictyostelium citrinum]
MGLGDNENQIFNWQLLVATIITKIICSKFKKELKYAQFFTFLIVHFGSILKFFQWNNHKRPSITMMGIVQYLAIGHVLFSSYYIIKDCDEISLKYNIKNDYIFSWIWGLVQYSLADENFPHLIIHISEFFSNLNKIYKIQIEKEKEKKLIYYSKMHKQLKNSPFKKDLDGAGGDFDDDFFEEVFLNKYQKDK